MPTPPPQKRAAIHTLGCRLNQSESAVLADKLAAAGYEVVPFGMPADLGIVHTCTVTREADAKSRKMLRRFLRENPESRAAVIGCYAQMDAGTLAEIEGVDLIVGNEEKLNLLDYLPEAKAASPVIVRDKLERNDFSQDAPAATTETMGTRPNLKIQDGCDFMCSFCIIPFARGRARSRDMANLLDEARSLAARGAKEIVLTGVNIGTYDLEGRSVLDVVEALNELPGVARIRISSIEATTIPEELFAWMADPQHALVPHLHIPLQAGADRTLERMRRKYTRQAFLDFILRAHEAVPGIGIGTDVLAGFPDETDADFAETREVLLDSPLFYAHVFKYSERPGTASLRISPKIPPQEIDRRAAELRGISARKTRLFQEHHFGREVEVLLEEQSGERWVGHTGNYLRVAVAGEGLGPNLLVPVSVAGSEEGMLHGEVAVGVAG